MKNLILILAVILSVSCKAQTKIIGLDDFSQDFIDGSYLKDLNYDLNKFVGIWKYQKGNTSFIINLKKVEKVFNEDYYADLLIGSYKYIENGVVILDFLNRLNNPSITPYYQYIVGSRILFKGQYPPCSNCDKSEKRIALYFEDPDPTREHISSLGEMVLRFKNIAGIDQLDCKIFIKGTRMQPDNAPTDFRVPSGDYVLIKQ